MPSQFQASVSLRGGTTMDNYLNKQALILMFSGAMLFLVTSPQVTEASHGERIMMGGSFGELSLVFTNQSSGRHHRASRSRHHRYSDSDRHGRPLLSPPVYRYPHHPARYRDYHRPSYRRHPWRGGHHPRPYKRYRHWRRYR